MFIDQLKSVDGTDIIPFEMTRTLASPQIGVRHQSQFWSPLLGGDPAAPSVRLPCLRLHPSHQAPLRRYLSLYGGPPSNDSGNGQLPWCERACAVTRPGNVFTAVIADLRFTLALSLNIRRRWRRTLRQALKRSKNIEDHGFLWEWGCGCGGARGGPI